MWPMGGLWPAASKDLNRGMCLHGGPFPVKLSDERPAIVTTLKQLQETPCSRESSSAMAGFLTCKNYEIINVYCFKLHF